MNGMGLTFLEKKKLDYKQFGNAESVTTGFLWKAV